MIDYPCLDESQSFKYITSYAKYSLMSKLEPGGRLNKKDGLTRYGDSHVKDKTS